MEKDNNLSEFMKTAYANGDVKDLNEAFIEYPVEEEWHQGNIDNVLREDSAKYGSYDIGDIVFVEKYNYNDGTKGSKHFFVIIDQNNTAVPIENFGMLISSHTEKLKYKENMLLEKSEETGLNRDSIVKTDVIYQILNHQILFKVGSVDLDKVETYKEAYYKRTNRRKIY